jgi:peptidoglycan/LPS O-acetylase OafA/YrhL
MTDSGPRIAATVRRFLYRSIVNVEQLEVALLVQRFGDHIFAWFAVAFWMFMINYVLLALLNTTDESRFYAYLPRLAGFALILAAIVDRNRGLPAK